MRIWFPAVKTNTGTDVYVERLANALRETGIEAAITWLPHWSEPFPALVGSTIPPPNTDIIHANSWNGFLYQKHHLPLVITEHHCLLSHFDRPSHVQRLYRKHILRKYVEKSYAAADAIVSVSHSTTEDIHKYFNISRPMTTIQNWIDTDVFYHDSTIKRFATPTLLFVGNASQRKGFDFLPEIAKVMAGRANLIVVSKNSNGQLSSRFKNVKEIDTRIDDVQLADLYRKSHVVVSPSRHEGFGYAAHEALACGTPVVGFRIPAYLENFGKLTPLLAEPFCIKSIIKIIERLIGDQDYFKRINSDCLAQSAIINQKTRSIDDYIAVYEFARREKIPQNRNV